MVMFSFKGYKGWKENYLWVSYMYDDENKFNKKLQVFVYQ